MKYMGSKSRIAKHIVPIIQQQIDDRNIKTYVEPFVGGANVIDKVLCERKIGNDNHRYLIALYNYLQENTYLPDHITKEEYSKVRECFNNQGHDYEDWYIGAVGFLSSYNGRWFDGGYSGRRLVGTGKVRDYYDEAKRNLLEQREKLLDIEFNWCDYKETNVKNALIYCDIPYKGVKQYSTSKNFNHSEFWEWASNMSKNNIVIVSELQAPNNWESIWEQEISRTVDNTKRTKSTEKLFSLIR